MQVPGDTKAGQLYDASPANDTLARAFRPSRFNRNTTRSRPDISRAQAVKISKWPKRNHGFTGGTATAKTANL
jgi:hypothetical protein